MSILLRDATTLRDFTATTEPSEVLTPDGRLLGQFIPTSGPKMSYPELGVTDEELKRILNDPNETRHTPEQVMTRLRELDRCSP